MRYPPKRDRMVGAYGRPRCPYCRRSPGPDCAVKESSRRRWRKIEARQWRRYADIAAQAEAAMDDAEGDITDCQHGCSGAPCVNERCNFTCHADDPQQSGHGDCE
jgi:hypothetical protein